MHLHTTFLGFKFNTTLFQYLCFLKFYLYDNSNRCLLLSIITTTRLVHFYFLTNHNRSTSFYWCENVNRMNLTCDVMSSQKMTTSGSLETRYFSSSHMSLHQQKTAQLDESIIETYLTSRHRFYKLPLNNETNLITWKK